MSAFFSISVRVFLILIKFIFLIFLTKFTTVNNIGEYALISSFLAVSVFLFGAELHSIACREVVIEERKNEKNLIFSNHLLFILMSGCLLLLIYAAFYWVGLIDNSLQWLSVYVILLCILDMFSQELGRYLLMLEMPISSNVTQLIRGGLWMIPCMLLIYTGKEINGQHISTIVISWLFGNFIAIIFGFCKLKRYLSLSFEFSKSWLLHSLSKARPYWGVAVIAQLQMYSDRFVLSFYTSNLEVGVLSVFQNFTNIIQTFVQVGVIGIFLPKLISLYHQELKEQYIAKLKEMLNQSFIICFSLSLVLLISINIVLDLIDKPLYKEYIDVYYMQLFSSVLFTFSLIPHIVLYSIKADRPLFKIAMISFPIYFLAMNFAVFIYGIYGAVISAVLFNMLMIIVKAKCALYYFKRVNNG